MWYTGIVQVSKFSSNGTFSAKIDGEDRFIDDVYPISISAREKGGIISPPKRGDKCLIFLDKSNRGYGLLTWTPMSDPATNTLSLSPNFPKSLQPEDIWIGSSESNYICLRGVGNLELSSAPMCYITLSSVEKKITNYCYNYEILAQGMTVTHSYNSITGITHQEIYQDRPIGTAPPKPSLNENGFYDYSIIDSYGEVKSQLTVDKLGEIKLKLGQIDVSVDITQGVQIAVNEPSTTKVSIDLLGNVDIKTDMVVKIDGSQVQLGKGATHPAVMGDVFNIAYGSHFHTAPSGVSGGPTSPPVTPLPPNVLSTKVLIA